MYQQTSPGITGLNAGNMGFRLRNAAEMYGRNGINVLMVDYRGYGEYFVNVTPTFIVCIRFKHRSPK
jgi:predicted alpha/beta hydrolase